MPDPEQRRWETRRAETENHRAYAQIQRTRPLTLGFALNDSPAATARLRTLLAAGRHALVVEAIDDTDPADPVVVGLGTVVLRVE